MKPLLLAAVLASSLATAAEPLPRVWKSKAGTELEATLARPGLTEALLRKSDGQTLAIPMDALSEGDREHVWKQLEKEDEFFRQRRTLLRLRKDSEEPAVVPVFQEGPWVGCAVVVLEKNYTFLLTGNLRAGLRLNHLSPDAPRQTITALSPTFQQMNPQAKGTERHWKGLGVAALKSMQSLPLVLEASPQGSELRMEIEFENGRSGFLQYTFEPNAIRISARIADVQHPTNLSGFQVSTQFPPTHAFGNEIAMAEIKKQFGTWRLELVPLGGGKEQIPWWQSANSGMHEKVKVIGPWEPWRFAFPVGLGEKGKGIHLALYPGFAPYQNGFRLSRNPKNEEGDLVLEWAMELER